MHWQGTPERPWAVEGHYACVSDLLLLLQVEEEEEEEETI